MTRRHRRLSGTCLFLALFVSLLGAEGCRQRAGEASARRDSVPAPAEPLIRQLPSVGRHGGRFVIGQTVNPKTFNATMATETSSADIGNLIFTTLVDYDYQTQKFGPELAKSWEVAPDGVTWTFHLRKGAAFSDGHPITADDVLFNFQVATDPVLHPSVQDNLKVGDQFFKMSAPDPYTIVIDTIKPNSALLDVMTVGGFQILPKHILEASFKSGNFASAYNVGTPVDKIVTSGPWKVAQFSAGEKTVLVPNPYYYGYDQNNQRLPYLNELTFLIVPDQDAADLKMRGGELDGLDNVKPENYKWYEEHQHEGKFTLYDLGPAMSQYFFWFNLNKVQPPVAGEKPVPGKRVGEPFTDPAKYSWFNDVTFRRAVSYAVDRDAMISSVFFGYAKKNWSLDGPSNKEWYIPDLVHYDYNPAEAKRLLAGLGWKDGNGDGVLEDTKGHPISFTLKTNADNLIRVGMANFVKDDLAKVGIKVTLAPIDFNTLITNLRNDFQYDAILMGLQSSVPPTPGNGQNFWRSNGETHNWFIKQQKPASPEEARIDQLMDEILTNMDLSAQKKAFREIQTIINEQSWLIWLPVLDIKVPVSNRFGNMRPSIMPHRILWNIDEVYVKQRES
jgi:peptide/nickel transport system substrate-binding protein